MDGWHLGNGSEDDPQGETLEEFILRVLTDSEYAGSDVPVEVRARFLAETIGSVMEFRSGGDWQGELAGLLGEGRRALARLMEVFEAENAGGGR